MTSDFQVRTERSRSDTSSIRALNTLAIKGLASMFDAYNQLFCVRLKRTGQDLRREGLSQRYTIMALMGLHRAAEFGFRNPYDAKSILDSLLKNAKWLDNIGDLGLLLWLCALMVPEQYEEIFRTLDVEAALRHYREAQEGRTMEMAWFLAGLAHGVLAGYQKTLGLSQLAYRSFVLIKRNQGRSGIFGHMASKYVWGALRGRLGSFADQVYSIYALSKYGNAFGCGEAVQMARECGEAICNLQGSLGQWWWHYDSETGRVVERYPVFSVHQDAMAPFALFALGESTKQDYSSWIFKGLEWIYGKNEINLNLCDTSNNIVWRNIFVRGPQNYFNEAASLLRLRRQNVIPSGLRVTYEDRPYHFGWVLYAFAQYGFE